MDSARRQFPTNFKIFFPTNFKMGHVERPLNWNFRKFSQVSSVQPITKLSRSTIDDPRSTVILRRCNRTDRRYRPCSTVGGTEPTVDIDHDQPTGRFIGGLVSIITCVLGPFLTTCGTIDFFVDDYLGPFFIAVGTIGR